ncbi:hypothetical protein L596_026231 [Steinernema carpocapsae]|uniref:Protein kinase domain-containing protein n=1 Tax=Steinernema carpocapsae TaxID=34508 RepID=A0A4U5M1R1_STECR|nr:hypothetical protein L596_026231 [Steinernema carpocapsae]
MPDVPKKLLDEAGRQRVTPDLINFMSDFQFPYLEDIDKYERVNKIGQGTFGEVFKARCRKTNRMVALKKILTENEKEGFPITALREIKMLQRLKSKYVTELIDICGKKNGPQFRDRCTFYLVFTFCDHDLAGLLNSKMPINLVQKKTLLKHLFEGLFTIHRNGILHRDMKAANVLIGSDGYLKLADFGLARPLFKKSQDMPEACYTNRVVTLWYRPPELLMGERNYGPAIDMWGAGLIMAEFWTRHALMQGETEQKQLDLITDFCGSITKDNWPNCEKLPYWGKIELRSGRTSKINERLKTRVNDSQALDLIERLMEMDPEKRVGAKDALTHKFFFTKPLANNDVKDLLQSLPTNLFEFTHGRGAQQHKPPQQHHPPAKKPRVDDQQFYDRRY